MICITAAILKALSYFFRTIQNTTPLHKVTLVLTPCKEVWGKSSVINKIDERYGTEFYAEWTFFKVTNSEYIQWLSEQSYGIAESESLIHFSILAGDSIVDVIAAYEPKITII